MMVRKQSSIAEENEQRQMPVEVVVPVRPPPPKSVATPPNPAVSLPPPPRTLGGVVPPPKIANVTDESLPAVPPLPKDFPKRFSYHMHPKPSPPPQQSPVHFPLATTPSESVAPTLDIPVTRIISQDLVVEPDTHLNNSLSPRIAPIEVGRIFLFFSFDYM